MSSSDSVPEQSNTRQQLCESNSSDLASDTVNRMMARMRSAHNRLLMLQTYEQELVSSVEEGLTTSQGLHQVPKIKVKSMTYQHYSRWDSFWWKSRETMDWHHTVFLVCCTERVRGRSFSVRTSKSCLCGCGSE